MPPRPTKSLERVALARETLREAVAAVWERLHRLQRERGPVRVLFTACEPGDGVTLVTLSVAEGLADHLRQRVQVIEANLARPALAAHLGLPAEPGLGELLTGRAPYKELFQDVPGHFGLRILPGGGLGRRAPGELATPLARKFWEGLEPEPFTLVDGGPLFDSADTRLLLQEVDAVVLVVRSRSTPRERVAEAVEVIQQYGAPLLGTVLNRYRSDMPLGLD